MWKSSEAPVDMNVLTRQVAINLRIDMDKHGVTTVAQWVSTLRVKQKLSYQQELNSFLLAAELGWTCCDPTFNFPPLGTAESPREDWDSGAQAYVTGQLRSIKQATHFHAVKENGTGFVKARCRRICGQRFERGPCYHLYRGCEGCVLER